jgi:lipoprotein-anchoring transpeptidase ErfK/SrfK
MQRICVLALLVGAFHVSAWAEPLQLIPGSSAVGGSSSPEQQTTVPEAATAPAYAAASHNLGGGFIQFLFGGAAAQVAGTSASEPVHAALVTASSAPSDEADATAAAAQQAADAKYDRQVVAYDGKEPPGTIVIDTPDKFLYLVEANDKAIRYGIGVGRPGFTWAGVKTITAKHEWPDWRPPVEMLKRQPDLPRFMAGGPDNPLGARALYLGSSLYRIHGSNEPWTIGHNVSSGCIRLRNADVIDLYNRVKVGTKVVVM